MWPLIVIVTIAAELVVVALLFKLVDFVEWLWSCWYARRDRKVLDRLWADEEEADFVIGDPRDFTFEDGRLRRVR
jgi:hypothetical protein